jgi:hypothetical protein
MKYLRLLLIFGWFFAVQTKSEVPGAYITTMVGPFADEGTCKSQYDALVEMLDAFGIQYAPKKCAYTQES